MPKAMPIQVESNRKAPTKALTAPHRHHALHSEIEHARALCHELADRCDQERRRGHDDGEQDRFESGHARALTIRNRLLTRASAESTQSNTSPWKASARSSGSRSMICAFSPADQDQRHDAAGDEDADRIEPPEKGHDDRREPVTRRDRRLHLAQHAGNLDNPGQPGQPAGNAEHGDDGARLRETGETRGARRIAAHPQPVAEQRAPEHDQGHDHGDQREDHADMHAPHPGDCGKRGGRVEDHGLREVEAHRIPPGAAHQIIKQQLRHIDEEERRQDLVDAETHAQKGGNRAVERAADHGEDHHQGQHPHPRIGAVGGECEPGAENGADDELPLRSDIPQIGAKAVGQTDGDDDKRRRLHGDLAQRPRIRQRIQDIDLEGGHGRATHAPDHQPGNGEGDNERRDRRERPRPRLRLHPRDEFNAHLAARPPSFRDPPLHASIPPSVAAG